jgi:hypothetical protein
MLDEVMRGRVFVVRNRWARWSAFLIDGVPLRYIVIRSYILMNGYVIATAQDLAMMDTEQAWQAA